MMILSKIGSSVRKRVWVYRISNKNTVTAPLWPRTPCRDPQDYPLRVVKLPYIIVMTRNRAYFQIFSENQEHDPNQRKNRVEKTSGCWFFFF